MDIEEIEGVVSFRNRMGDRSFYRLQRDEGDVLVQFVRTKLGVVAYDTVKNTALGDHLRVTGYWREHPRLGLVLVANTILKV